MKRRLFVKQTSIASLGVLAFSSVKTHAKNNEEAKNTVIDLLPFANATRKTTLKGAIVDATTHMPIEDCKMEVTAKTNRLFKTSKIILTPKGEYTILSGFTADGKTLKKLEVKITAAGYKTYIGNVYLTANSCNLHSDTWNYNKNFDSKYCPKNTTIGNETFSEFNFQLVK
jgi:hypothetical protein